MEQCWMEERWLRSGQAPFSRDEGGIRGAAVRRLLSLFGEAYLQAIGADVRSLYPSSCLGHTKIGLS